MRRYHPFGPRPSTSLEFVGPEQGYGGRVAGLRGLGDTANIGGIKFAKTETAKDFTNGKGQNGGCDARGGVFRQIPANQFAQINQRIAELANGYDTSGIEAWTQKAQSYAAECDRLQEHDDPVNILAFILPWETGPQLTKCGRTEGREKAYLVALNRLKAHYLTVLSIRPAQPPAEEMLPVADLPPYVPSSAANTQTSLAPNVGTSKSGLTSTPQRGGGVIASTPTAGTHNAMVIAAGLLGISAVGAVVYTVTRKKKAV